MEFRDHWGVGLITVTLDTNRLPYLLTERYGNCVRHRRYWSRLDADTEHAAAVRNAQFIIDAIRDARPEHRTGSFLHSTTRRPAD